MRYEIYFKDHGGNTFSVAHLDAVSDRQAIARARRIFCSGIGACYEIWRRGVYLHEEVMGGSSCLQAGGLSSRRPRRRRAVSKFPSASVRQTAPSEDHDAQRHHLDNVEKRPR